MGVDLLVGERAVVDDVVYCSHWSTGHAASPTLPPAGRALVPDDATDVTSTFQPLPRNARAGPLWHAMADAAGGTHPAKPVGMFPHTLALAALALLTSTPLAAATSGTATLTGTAKLAVPGCGRERDAFSPLVSVSDDGRWTAAADDDDDPDDDPGVAGTYTTEGRSARSLRLEFDEPSRASLTADAEDDLATKCGTPTATVTSSQPKKLRLVLNRKRTKAKLVLRWVFEGTAGGRPRSVRYRVIARGPWTDGTT